MAVPYIGSKISLISKSDIRYEGILYAIDTKESKVYLQNVRRFGTEDRRPNDPVPPSDDIYEYIIFRGSDIKDLFVCETPKQEAAQPPKPQVQDAAIVGMSGAGGQMPYPMGQQPQQTHQPQGGFGGPQNYGYGPYGYNYPPQPFGPYSGHPSQFGQMPQHGGQHLGVQQGAPLIQQQQQQPPSSQQQQQPQQPQSQSGEIPSHSASTLQSPVIVAQQPVKHVVQGSDSDFVQDGESHAVNQEKVNETSTQRQSQHSQANGASSYTHKPSDDSAHHSGRKFYQQNQNQTTHHSQQHRQGGSRGRGRYDNRRQHNQPAQTPQPSTLPEFDFEQSNSKFNKEELAVEFQKHSTEDVEEDQDGSEVLAALNLNSAGKAYNKDSSFFDTISCESLEKTAPKPHRSKEELEKQRKTDLETFGMQQARGEKRDKKKKKNKKKTKKKKKKQECREPENRGEKWEKSGKKGYQIGEEDGHDFIVGLDGIDGHSGLGLGHHSSPFLYDVPYPSSLSSSLSVLFHMPHTLLIDL